MRPPISVLKVTFFQFHVINRTGQLLAKVNDFLNTHLETAALELMVAELLTEKNYYLFCYNEPKMMFLQNH